MFAAGTRWGLRDDEPRAVDRLWAGVASAGAAGAVPDHRHGVLGRVDGITLEEVSDFSAEQLKAYGLDALKITLHCGMGAGAMQALHVHGSLDEAGGGGERVSGESRALLSRDGFALMGEPFAQLKESEERAASGECVVPPTMWKLVEGAVEATVDADGYAALHPPFRATGGAPHRSARDNTIAALLAAQAAGDTKSWMRRVESHVPESVKYRLREAGKNWLAELRVASIVFMRILSINNDTPDVLNKTQHVFAAMHAALVKYRGVMARFNVDDKGTIMFAAFGPPPTAHEDDAVRATLCALHIVKEMEADGHTVRAGITTGEVFMGSVGNADRGEYTFYGTTVNMAARLMVNKANTGVLVDEPTALDDSVAPSPSDKPICSTAR